MGQSGVREIN